MVGLMWLSCRASADWSLTDSVRLVPTSHRVWEGDGIMVSQCEPFILYLTAKARLPLCVDAVVVLRLGGGVAQ